MILWSERHYIVIHSVSFGVQKRVQGAKKGAISTIRITFLPDSFSNWKVARKIVAIQVGEIVQLRVLCRTIFFDLLALIKYFR